VGAGGGTSIRPSQGRDPYWRSLGLGVKVDGTTKTRGGCSSPPHSRL
jgi:hypothetical protein